MLLNSLVDKALGVIKQKAQIRIISGIKKKYEKNIYFFGDILSADFCKISESK